jgi:23S rRNA (uracil1939-C5)-methyltransferase
VVPEETVQAKVIRVHRRHVEAALVAIEESSPHRASIRCGHYHEGCGGCSWQHVSYAMQLVAKEEAVRDSLERLAGIHDPPIRPILAAPAVWNYRNKMEFAFHPDGTLGLHPRGAWYDILSLRECHLPAPATVAIVKRAQAFVREHGLSLYDPRSRAGFLRELVVRQSGGTGEILVGIVTSPGSFPLGKAMAADLAKVDPAICSVVHSIRRLPDTAAPIGETSVLFGRNHIIEVIAGLRFRLQVETFFQTNSTQAEQLVRLVKEAAGNIAGEEVIDVYCGVGVFTLALAAMGARAVGVELVATAIEAAQENARTNAIEGTRFFAGDARKVLSEVLPAGMRPKVLVLDPPRAGAGGKVMRRIARSEPGRIIYVSCNPTTLARDLVELFPFGYQVVSVEPVDLFPQTYHVETVVVLDRITSEKLPV